VTGLLDAAERLALRVEPRRLALVVLLCIALLTVLGIARFAHKDALSAFNLDGERNVPALFSGALWTCVGVLAVLVGRARSEAAWYLLAGLFLLLAADEVLEFHERLENLTGVDWQILYAPVALAAAPLWVVIGLRLKRIGVGFVQFAAATLCIIAAQPLEALQVNSHGDPQPGFRVFVVSEEVLEMISALLLGLALLAVLRIDRSS
jgi:hypothetical protein